MESHNQFLEQKRGLDLVAQYHGGPMRAWIDGSAYDRNGFSIHGGLSPGSAGCIDLTRQVVPFMLQFQSYAGSSTVPLIVQYPGGELIV